MKENYHQAKDFCNRWQGMGVDAVRLKRFFNFAGNVEDLSPESPDKENIDRRNIPVETRAKSSRPPCYLPWRQLAFYYDGTAVACCHDFLHQGVIGNIHDASLRKIWNSDAMVTLRRNHLQRRQDKIPLCKGCNQPEVSAAQVVGTAVCNASRAKNLLITMERLGRRLGFKPFY